MEDLSQNLLANRQHQSAMRLAKLRGGTVSTQSEVAAPI